MVIKVMSRDEINMSKYNAYIKDLEKLQAETVEYIKNALELLINIDHLYDIRNYIDQLLIDWQEIEFDEEEDRDE